MEKFEEGGEETSHSSFFNEEKSLARWRFELKSLSKRHWGVFYEHFLGESISNYPRFYRALKLYGDMAVFEAVLAAARQSVEGDPLNYVLKITHSLWKEEQLELEKEYQMNSDAKASIETTRKQNKALEDKLKKIKRG